MMTSETVVNASAMAEILRQLISSLEQLKQVIMQIDSAGEVAEFWAFMEEEVNDLGLPEMEVLMREIHAELESWELGKLRVTEDCSGLKDKAGQVLQLINYHFLAYRSKVLYNSSNSVVEYDPDSNKNTYLFLNAVISFYEAIANSSSTYEDEKEKAKQAKKATHFGIMPKNPLENCTCDMRSLTAGFKLALAVLLVAIIQSSTLTPESARYGASGVSFVVYVMGGNPFGTSYSKSYNRLLGVVCGMCLPSRMEDWVDCYNNVLIVSFAYIWLCISGTVYGGAVPMFYYAGLVCGFVSLMELTYMSCDSTSTTDLINSSFTGMSILLLVEMVVVRRTALQEFQNNVRRFWQAFGADTKDTALINGIFSLYLSKQSITGGDSTHSRLVYNVARKTTSDCLNTCESRLARAAQFLGMAEDEPRKSAPLATGYAPYLQAVSDMQGQIERIHDSMARVMNDCVSCCKHYATDGVEVHTDVDTWNEHNPNMKLEDIRYHASERVDNPLLIQTPEITRVYIKVEDALIRFASVNCEIFKILGKSKGKADWALNMSGDLLVKFDDAAVDVYKTITQLKELTDEELVRNVASGCIVYPGRKIISHYHLIDGLEKVRDCVTRTHKAINGTDSLDFSRNFGKLVEQHPDTPKPKQTNTPKPKENQEEPKENQEEPKENQEGDKTFRVGDKLEYSGQPATVIAVEKDDDGYFYTIEFDDGTQRNADPKDCCEPTAQFGDNHKLEDNQQHSSLS
jgi:hypothetical protein